ncbi:tetratricopeptide repeat protein [Lentzea sp. NPDC042327]|uniref:tetratricopeptide repeat protein n=1 Tax=Lentzea sp. NPDC042327 TaxID=3154801 RepID=UPI0034100847
MDHGEDAGLAFQPGEDSDLSFVRKTAEAFEPLDLGRRGAFAPEPEIGRKTRLGEIGDRFEPTGDGLWIDADDDRLRDDLAKLEEHQADLRLRALLTNADRALRAGRAGEAWEHVEAALRIAPANVAALLLGARCHDALEAFDSALDLLATARQHATDADEVTVLLRLRDGCRLRLTKHVTVRADELLREGRTPEAVEYTGQRRAKHPDVLGLHYVHGSVLLIADRPAQAREVVEAALATAPDSEMFAELHRVILSRLCKPQVDRACRSLRAGQPKAAIEHLEVCGDALHSEPMHEWLWSYAHERYAKKVPIIGWRRARRANVVPLDADSLQEVLGRLLTEEFTEVMKAFERGDFEAAGEHCERAEAIDGRYGTIAYLHATAEALAADKALRTINLRTLTIAERHLSAAARIAPKMAFDPELTAQRDKLTARIDSELAEVARLKRFITCVSRFNDLMSRYEHQSITSRYELQNVRSELISIRKAAHRSRQEHPPNSPAQQTLDRVIIAVDSNLRSLPT